MSLSLDMIGKFVLVVIIISVVTGLIMQFETDVTSSIADLLGGKKDNTGAKVVQVSSNPDQKIASLIDSCYKQSVDNTLDNFVCFIARTESGSINFKKNDISNSLSDKVRSSTEFAQTNYDSSTVVIRYSSGKGKVVVD